MLFTIIQLIILIVPILLLALAFTEYFDSFNDKNILDKYDELFDRFNKEKD